MLPTLTGKNYLKIFCTLYRKILGTIMQIHYITLACRYIAFIIIPIDQICYPLRPVPWSDGKAGKTGFKLKCSKYLAVTWEELLTIIVNYHYHKYDNIFQVSLQFSQQIPKPGLIVNTVIVFTSINPHGGMYMATPTGHIFHVVDSQALAHDTQTLP